MSRYDDGPGLFGYLFRLIVILALVSVIGFLAFAYFGDLSRTPEPRSIPIDLNES
jgi:hypothetical protein